MKEPSIKELILLAAKKLDSAKTPDGERMVYVGGEFITIPRVPKQPPLPKKLEPKYRNRAERRARK